MTVVQILQINVVQEQQQQCSGSKASGIGEKGTQPMLLILEDAVPDPGWEHVE